MLGHHACQPCKLEHVLDGHPCRQQARHETAMYAACSFQYEAHPGRHDSSTRTMTACSVAYLRIIQQLHSSKAVMRVGVVLASLLLHCCHHTLQLGLLLLFARFSALQDVEVTFISCMLMRACTLGACSCQTQTNTHDRSDGWQMGKQQYIWSQHSSR